jgi:alpha-aminoadipic semialdehyde synthase
MFKFTANTMSYVSIIAQDINVRSEDLLKRSIANLPVSDVLKFEGIPNRDSISYEELYANGRRGELSTLFRGTLR